MNILTRGTDGEAFERRRAFLVRALTLGAFAGGWAWIGHPRTATAMASLRALPPGRSIYRLEGEAWIDGRRADEESTVPADAEIVTGAGSELIFVVGTDAFILREKSRLALAPVQGADVIQARSSRSVLLHGLHLLSGKLLSVFGERDEQRGPDVRTPVATIGIRGTGVYIESEPDRTYVCTCYGTTELRSLTDARSRERITSSHHDEPRYVLGEGASGRRIEPAPVINHTDMELELVEALVGREPPFVQGPSQRDRY